MRPRTLPLLAITVATLLLVLGPVAQAADNNVGTWKLNLAKSKYIPGPAPFEGTLKIEPETNGLKFTIHGCSLLTFRSLKVGSLVSELNLGEAKLCRCRFKTRNLLWPVLNIFFQPSCPS